MKLSKHVCAMILMLACGCSSRVGQECADSAACGLGEYCAFEVGSCGDDDTGVCEIIPDVCTLVFSPVCGCDGQTYDNDCVAAAAGVSVASSGACEQTGCGGIAGVICDDGDYCKFEVGSCGQGDQSGICETIPDACVEIFDPVCGCDDQTYSNECVASAAGVSVAEAGACEEEICCAEAEEPGFGDNPLCFEGASCCADGEWKCNNGDGSPSCDEAGTPCKAEEICCDAAGEPGIGGNPTCFEGASCCADGEWKCNNGDGSSSCDEAGTPCKADGNSRPKSALSPSDEGEGKSLEYATPQRSP